MLGLAVGVALGGFVLWQVGFIRVLGLVRSGMSGFALILLIRGVQFAITGLAWWSVSRPLSCEPSPATFTLLRWLREGINSLLPVAQVGGLLLTIRLLCRFGQTSAVAMAATIADASVELVTQIVFTLFGLVVLADINADDVWAPGVLSGFAFISGAAAAAIAAQKLGGVRLAERAAARLGWSGVVGLHEALMAVYRQRGALGRAAIFHLSGWLLGGVEVVVAFHFLGWDIGIGQGLVIESLGQAVRTAGFAVPSALGVQEGGFILVCGLVGLPADGAVALSLVKRLRDIAFGIPSLAVWQWLEARKGEDSSGQR